MRGVAREQRQLDAGLADRDPAVSRWCSTSTTFTRSSASSVEQLRELAGPVGDARAHDEVAAGEREPVAHHRDEQRGVDVSAREQRRARPAPPPTLPASSAATLDRARALDDELRPLEQEDDGLAISSSVTETMSSSVSLEDRHRQLARLLHGDPVRDRVARPVRAASPPPARRRSAARAAPRAARARCRTRARRRRSGCTTVSSSVDLVGELEPDRPLARRSRAGPRTDGRTSRRSARRTRAPPRAPPRTPPPVSSTSAP